jgi:hypothetical protein
MMLLHGLLLVFSVIAVAPLMIICSMTIPNAPGSEEELEPAIEAAPVRQRSPKAVEEAPVIYARQLSPAPAPRVSKATPLS